MTLETVWMIAAGGALGATIRSLIGLSQARWTTWPGWVGVLIANLIGCLMIGVAVGVQTQSPWTQSPWNTALVMTGVCGGLTTFSSFALELALLGLAGAWRQVAACLLLSVGGGVGLVYVGIAATTWIGAAA